MKTCPICGAQTDDSNIFCSSCGARFEESEPVNQISAESAEYDEGDVAKNKIFGILAYVGSLLGIIVALLAAPDSPFVQFHIRQSVKLFICQAIVGLITLVLCWTVIVPILGGIAMLVLFVVEIICIVRACKGEMQEAPIVSGIGFLK